MTHYTPRCAAALALLAAAALAGCSSNKRLTVPGTVTYKGRPLPSGIVRFYFGPGGDRMSMATLEPDGSFAATDVPPGPVKVTVEPDPQAAKHRSMGGAADEPAPKPVTIPPRYADPATSGLEYTISSGANKLEIKLE
jgi:hypothetical protein